VTLQKTMPSLSSDHIFYTFSTMELTRTRLRTKMTNWRHTWRCIYNFDIFRNYTESVSHIHKPKWLFTFTKL